jgi:hypothetical protein
MVQQSSDFGIFEKVLVTFGSFVFFITVRNNLDNNHATLHLYLEL